MRKFRQVRSQIHAGAARSAVPGSRGSGVFRYRHGAFAFGSLRHCIVYIVAFIPAAVVSLVVARCVYSTEPWVATDAALKSEGSVTLFRYGSSVVFLIGSNAGGQTMSSGNVTDIRREADDRVSYGSYISPAPILLFLRLQYPLKWRLYESFSAGNLLVVRLAALPFAVIVIGGLAPLARLVYTDVRRLRRRRRGQCQTCGYLLCGSPSGRCPECGVVSARRV